MPLTKQVVVGFFVRVVAVFLFFYLAWPMVGGGFAFLFQKAGHPWVALGSRGTGWLDAPAHADGYDDTQVVVTDVVSRQKRTTLVSSRRHAYLPLSFSLALALATPLSWWRRLRMAGVNVAFVGLYVAAKLALFPIAYGGDPTFLGSGSRWILWVVSAPAAGWMLPPLVIWLMTCLRVPVWSRVPAKAPSADTAR